MPRVKSIVASLPEPETIDVRALSDACSSGEVDLVCVLGPTASGKTRYAVNLAAELGGEIISADSRQVYRGMDIGTGKDLSEYGGIPYHIIDVADPGEQYNVFRFKEDFSRAYEDIRSRGRIPILCGGTGLYINAVTRDYDFKGNIPLSAPRSGIQGMPDTAAPDILGESRCRIPASPELPGEHRGSATAAPQLKTYFIGTLVDRETRNARIDARLDARLKDGMVEEIKGLLDRGVPPEILISYGLEYKFVTLFLKGELTFARMREQLAIAIHQFAKRQMTWFRGMERSGAVIHWTRV